MVQMVKEKSRIGEIGGEVPTNDGRNGIEFQMPYRVSVTLTGDCPMLFHAWSCESVQSKADAKKGSKEKKTDDVESYVVRNEKGEVCIPGSYLCGSICKAAKFHQDPRSPRKSALDLFKAGVVSLTDLASLGVKECDYLDKRRVVIKMSAITRTRPAMHKGWTATFILMVILPEYIDSSMLNSVIAQAGKLIGLADYRPTYGRFSITNFKVLSD